MTTIMSWQLTEWSRGRVLTYDWLYRWHKFFLNHFFNLDEFFVLNRHGWLYLELCVLV